jgi:hypothetical protein
VPTRTSPAALILDPGWPFVIAALVILAAWVLIPAAHDREDLEVQLGDLDRRHAALAERTAEQRTAILEIARVTGEPLSDAEVLSPADREQLRRLSLAVLTRIPADQHEALVDRGARGTLLERIVPPVAPAPPPDETASVREPSRLESLVSGPGRLWVAAAAAFCLFFGLVLGTPARSAERTGRDDEPEDAVEPEPDARTLPPPATTTIPPPIHRRISRHRSPRATSSALAPRPAPTSAEATVPTATSPPACMPAPVAREPFGPFPRLGPMPLIGPVPAPTEPTPFGPLPMLGPMPAPSFTLQDSASEPESTTECPMPGVLAPPPSVNASPLSPQDPSSSSDVAIVMDASPLLPDAEPSSPPEPEPAAPVAALEDDEDEFEYVYEDDDEDEEEEDEDDGFWYEDDEEEDDDEDDEDEDDEDGDDDDDSEEEDEEEDDGYEYEYIDDDEEDAEEEDDSDEDGDDEEEGEDDSEEEDDDEYEYVDVEEGEEDDDDDEYEYVYEDVEEDEDEGDDEDEEKPAG